MLNGEDNENSKKKTNKQTTKQTKQNKAKYNMKLPELHVLWRNLVSHVFLFVFFLTAANFHLSGY